ncbi:hypothetical protein ABZ646_46470, partial [Streptomyces sp. NPDC007162]
GSLPRRQHHGQPRHPEAATSRDGWRILEGIHYRYTLGQTLGQGFDRIGELVPVFIDHGLTTLQEG